MTDNNVIFCFDVASGGLHGVGFAVGWVLSHRTKGELDSGYLEAPFATNYSFTASDNDWVSANVLPALPGPTHCGRIDVLEDFWNVLRTAVEDHKALVVADCLWPVEANFVSSAVMQNVRQRAFKGPYPFHEVATLRLAAGLDPLATCERLPSELPAHNPLADARQSARLWWEAWSTLHDPH